MKTTRFLLLLAVLTAFTACNKKQPIPSDKENYIGLWQPENPNADENIELEINADGTGRYSTVKKGKQVEYTGYVYFRNANEFSIGGKLIKKKITIDRPPVKIVESLQPYVYHYEAIFNDVKFRKQE